MNSEEEKVKGKEPEEKEEDTKEEAVKPSSKTSLDSFMKLSIAISILLVSLSISYYFFFFLPSREKTRAENLEKCLSTVNSNYEKAWDYNCKKLSRKENCTLPLPVADSLDKYYRDQKEDCFKKYPGKK
jgi:flagellar basal body-associated protein FliL